jgi:hypothetical protein
MKPTFNISNVEHKKKKKLKLRGWYITQYKKIKKN